MITVLASASALQQYQPLIMLGLIIVIMWFFIFRPQQKKQKEIQNFRNSIKEGQEVVTAGGIYGVVKKIQEEVNSYRKGGSRAGMFPERWLPAAIIVADEPFTEQNHMVNSTMKIVRGKVEKHYADRIEYALTAEGKNLLNEKNIASL